MKKGKFIGAGVGPGDPELITLKTIRYLKECDVILCPGKSVLESVAYKIAVSALPLIKEKEIINIYMPMTKDEKVLKKSHKEAGEKVVKLLEEGKNVLFITLGDVSIYSTFSYIAKYVKQLDYEVKCIPGIPSFVDAACKIGVPLCLKDEELHIIPATYKKDILPVYDGNNVYMKIGNKINLLEKSIDKEFYYAENLGMNNEKIIVDREKFPQSGGYLTIVIAKEKDM